MVMVRTLLMKMVGRRVMAKMLRLKGEEQRALLCSSVSAPAWKHRQDLEKAKD